MIDGLTDGPAFSPCGAVVGVVRSAYDAPCRWYPSGPTGRIVYYFVPDTNPILQGPNVFHPYSQLLWNLAPGDTGEIVPQSRHWRRGNSLTDPIPDGPPCGTEADFGGRGIPPEGSIDGWIPEAALCPCDTEDPYKPPCCMTLEVRTWDHTFSQDGECKLEFNQDAGFSLRLVGGWEGVDILPASTTQTGVITQFGQTFGGDKVFSAATLSLVSPDNARSIVLDLASGDSVSEGWASYADPGAGFGVQVRFGRTDDGPYVGIESDPAGNAAYAIYRNDTVYRGVDCQIGEAVYMGGILVACPAPEGSGPPPPPPPPPSGCCPHDGNMPIMTASIENTTGDCNCFPPTMDFQLDPESGFWRCITHTPDCDLDAFDDLLIFCSTPPDGCNGYALFGTFFLPVGQTVLSCQCDDPFELTIRASFAGTGCTGDVDLVIGTGPPPEPSCCPDGELQPTRFYLQFTGQQATFIIPIDYDIAAGFWRATAGTITVITPAGPDLNVVLATLVCIGTGWKCQVSCDDAHHHLLTYIFTTDPNGQSYFSCTGNLRAQSGLASIGPSDGNGVYYFGELKVWAVPPP